MGLDAAFGTAFAKSQAASFSALPTSGTVFVSVANRDKRHAIFPIKRLADLGFRILATEGTAQVLRRHDVAVTVLRKASQGTGPNGEPTVVQAIAAGEIDLVVNTPHGHSLHGSPRQDGWEIRGAAIRAGVPCVTTTQALAACVQGVESLRQGTPGVRSLQSWNAAIRADLHRSVPPGVGHSPKATQEAELRTVAPDDHCTVRG